MPSWYRREKGFELGPRNNMQFNWSAYSGAWWYLSTSDRAQIRGIKVSGCWDPADSYRRMSGVGRLWPWWNNNNSQRLCVTNAAPLTAANLLACNLFCDKYLVIFALLYFYPWLGFSFFFFQCLLWVWATWSLPGGPTELRAGSAIGLALHPLVPRER